MELEVYSDTLAKAIAIHEIFSREIQLAVDKTEPQ